MKLLVNGSTRVFEDVRTLAELIEHLNYETRRIAVAVNRQHVPRRNLGEQKLQEGDEVEILAPMAGG